MTCVCRVVLFTWAVILLSGCSGGGYDMPALNHKTAGERQATLQALRRAWSERPEGTNDEACLYERAVLNRAALFGRKVQGTESYVTACNFWRACAREHIARYGRMR